MLKLVVGYFNYGSKDLNSSGKCECTIHNEAFAVAFIGLAWPFLLPISIFPPLPVSLKLGSAFMKDHNTNPRQFSTNF